MNVMDLFAGCGGMSLGFEMAGCSVVYANEMDDWAADTYEKNHMNTHLQRSDIYCLKDLGAISKKSHGLSIDGIVGGPPCQGYSLSGNRDQNDPRNSLFMEFVRFVDYFKPAFFVMENVPGLLSMYTSGEIPVIDIIMDEFHEVGYKAFCSTLNAASYGVPQLRERIFIVGVANSYPYNRNLLFPKPQLLPDEYVSVETAIGDLPSINAGEGEEFREYTNPSQNKYQEWARKKSLGVYNHVAMRHTKRVIERFKVIKHGQSVKHVPYEHSALKRGNPSVKSGKVFSQNNMRVIPDQPSPTIAASFQSNFVHPFLDRNFTAREGARLQSFPDSYVFCGKRTTMSWEKNLSQYQQIGNAVPPLLAKAIATSIKRYFNRITNIKDDGCYERHIQPMLFDAIQL
ncbi:MAG: DNA cytosine methyltransferase [Planctomycetota bacterium]